MRLAGTLREDNQQGHVLKRCGASKRAYVKGLLAYAWENDLFALAMVSWSRLPFALPESPSIPLNTKEVQSTFERSKTRASGRSERNLQRRADHAAGAYSAEQDTGDRELSWQLGVGAVLTRGLFYDA